MTLDELPIPPAATEAHRSVELMRIWLASEHVHCVLKIGFWEKRYDERECWGILLADVVHHIANAHQEEYGRDRTETIKIICEMLDAELKRPTSDRLGEFIVDKDDAHESES